MVAKPACIPKQLLKLFGYTSHGQIDRGICIQSLLCYLIVVRFVVVMLALPPPDTVAVGVTELGALAFTFTINVIGG